MSAVIKAYDIRGLVPQEWDASVARALGSAFAQVVVQPEGEPGVVVGHDMRPTSPELAGAFTAGIAGHGIEVTMIGLASSDGLYYASGALGLAGAMITASHNPAGYNGIKLCRSGARPVGRDSGLTEIGDLAQWLLDRGHLHSAGLADRAGTVTERDLLADYSDHLHSLVDLRGGRPLTVVVDAGNGMAGHTAPAVLTAPGLPITLIPLYFELDGTFPNHDANPLEPENLVDLQRAVRQHRADLGLAFDGDADRCFVVDERGAPVTASSVGALVAAREIDRERRSGRPGDQVAVVYNSICSRSVSETITALGARPVRSRVGHSYIKAQMAEHDAVFGAEHSGHYYFRDFWYADSGMLAALHVLAALGEQPHPLSALVADYDRYAVSGEVNTPLAGADAQTATGRVERWAKAQGASADTLDGLIMSQHVPQHPVSSVEEEDLDREFGNEPWWWFSLRGSNTQPTLRLNVEAEDEATMTWVRDTVLDLIRQED